MSETHSPCTCADSCSSPTTDPPNSTRWPTWTLATQPLSIPTSSSTQKADVSSRSSTARPTSDITRAPPFRILDRAEKTRRPPVPHQPTLPSTSDQQDQQDHPGFQTYHTSPSDLAGNTQHGLQPTYPEPYNPQHQIAVGLQTQLSLHEASRTRFQNIGPADSNHNAFLRQPSHREGLWSSRTGTTRYGHDTISRPRLALA
jgi:hypothetical protein